MLFPDTFYYKEPISGKEYTQLPSGRPDVNRLLDQKADFWEKPCYQQGEKKKKQLIFLDWRVFCLSSDNREHYLQQLQLLFDEGFSVWFPTYDTHLLLKNASELLIYADTWNPSASMAMQATIQQGIARDHITILDYFVMGQCLPKLYTTTDQKNPVTRYFYQNAHVGSDSLLKASDLQTLVGLNPDYYSQISNALIAQPPTSLSVVIDVDDEKLLDFLSKLPIKRALLNNNLLIKTLLAIENPRFSSKINEFYIDLPDLLPTAIDLLKLKGLSYCGQVTEAVKLLLTRFNQLQILNLSSNYHNSTELSSSLKDLELPALRELDFSGTSFNVAELRDFLKRSPQLSKLSLRYCKTDLSGLFEGLELPALRALNFSGASFNVAELSDFLKRSPQLSKLDLSYCRTNLSNLFVGLKLPTLRTLDFSGTSFNVAELSDFLKRSPQLLKLDLISCETNLSGLLKDLKLPVLQELDLSKARVNIAELHNFLKRSSQLSQLNLRYCSANLSGLFDGLELPALRALNFSGASSFNVAELGDFLKRSPHLFKLNLISCETNLSGLLKDLKLPVLQELNLFEARLNVAELGDFLKRSPQLSQLNLSYCKTDLSGLFKDLKLPALRELYLGYVRFNVAELSDFLKRSSQLPQLNLSYCKTDLSGLFEGLKLPALRELYLGYVRFNVAELGDFLKRSPQLLKLDLRSCETSLSGLFKGLKLPILQELDLSKATLNVAELHNFLKRSAQLTKLDLSYCPTNLSNLFVGLKLPTLRTLHLSKASFNVVGLRDFLKHSQPLSKLDLSDCPTNLSGLLKEDLELPALRELHLSKAMLNVAELHNFLKRSPQLTKLDLRYCPTNLSNLFVGLKLPMLRALNLSKGSFNVVELRDFLKRSPQLSKLDLSDFSTNLSGLLKDFELPALLRALNLDGTMLNMAELQLRDFLKWSHQPPKRDLRSGKINFSDLLKDLELPASRELDLEGPKLDRSGLEAFLESYQQCYVTDHNDQATMSSGKKTILDADTTFNPEKELSAQTFFTPDPGVNHYRLDVYDGLSSNTGNLELEPIKALPKPLAVQPVYSNNIQKTERCIYTGQIVMELNQTDWMPLPSLFPNEQLTAYQASTAQQLSVQLELAYSDNSNQYFIRLASGTPPQAQRIQIQYQLKVAEPPSAFCQNSPVTSEQKKWVQLAQQLRFHADGRLETNDAYQQLQLLKPQQRIAALTLALEDFEIDLSHRVQHAPMKDYTDFNYFIEKQVGACRHRANLFLALAKPLGITARVVTNDSHAFVEINDDDKWTKRDLGGYPAQLREKPLQTLPTGELEKSQRKERITPELSEQESFPISSPPISLATGFTVAITQLHTELAAYRAEQQQALLIFPSTADIDSFYLYLRDEKNMHAQRVLYLPSFRELKFQAIKVTQIDTGYEKIDSPFIRDLKQLKTRDVLLINFDRYQMTDVGYNTLFDTPRRLGDVHIPEGVVIIAAMDSVISQQIGEDVLSRFPIKQSWQLPLPERDLLKSAKDNAEFALVIDLYDSPYWKESLIGQLQYTGQPTSPFMFKPSAFQQALDQITENKNIEIRHAPIDADPSCKRFFADLAKYRTIESNGEKIRLPESLTWQLTSPAYEFKGKMTVEPVQTDIAWDQVLSPYTLDGLFYRHRYCNKAHTFTESPGLLADYAGKTLRLYVTQNLAEGEWAKLCQQAETYNCQLHFILGENVKLPTRLAEVAKLISSTAIETTTTPAFSAQCYQSNDADLVLSRLKQSNHHCITIPIDQNTSYADLVSPMQIDASENKAALPSFHIQDGELLNQLKAGKKVILKGIFSPELALQLASLFATKPFLQVNGELCSLTIGQVIFITEQKDVFSFLAKDKQYKEQKFTHTDRFEQLAREGVSSIILRRLEEEGLEALSFSYNQLKAISENLKHFPDKNPLKPLAFFDPDHQEKLIELGKKLKLPPARSLKTNALTHVMSHEETTTLSAQKGSHPEESKRLERLKAQLTASPYVFIMGPSGIGKSTLILEKLQPYYASKGQTLQLSVGMDQMVRWASDIHPDKMHILFLDEANLSKEGSFDCFEGLFDETPTIFVQGKQYPLTPQHKLIFCGNPAAFQGRQTHQFFQRHGHGLQFKDWSDRFLLATILGPLLKQVNQICSLALSKIDQEQIAEFLLKGYRSLSEQTQQSLTPRNLQMMLLRFATLCQKNDSRRPLQNAYLALYDEVKPYLPKPLRKDWKLNFQQGKSYRDLRVSHQEMALLPLGKRYIIPPSRRRAFELVQDHLTIREQRINTPELQAQGLHGLLLEGASGIGKSALVIELLCKRGYKENSPDLTKCYYYLTLTDPGKIDEVLTKAFHEGAIVVIDELNTAPIEKILNALMSGVDLEGKPPQQTGFFVVGTQNPISFANRQPLSPALANRFYKINVKEYSMAELQHILIHKGVEKNEAETKIKVYEEHNAHTSIEALKYTPRDLFRGGTKK